MDEIAAKLLAVVDPDDRQRRVTKVYAREEVYHDRGHLEVGPDLRGRLRQGHARLERVGARPARRSDVITDNTEDWSGDHCMDHESGARRAVHEPAAAQAGDAAPGPGGRDPGRVRDRRVPGARRGRFERSHGAWRKQEPSALRSEVIDVRIAQDQDRQGRCWPRSSATPRSRATPRPRSSSTTRSRRSSPSSRAPTPRRRSRSG